MEPAPISAATKARIADAGGRRRGAHRLEGVTPVRAGEQREGDEQRQRAETRHDQIDVARARVLVLAVMRHHQRPGGERHELPRQQERVGVGGDEHEVHAREEGGKERQHALRIVLVTAVAERVQARGDGGEVRRRRERTPTARRRGNARRSRAGRAAGRASRRGPPKTSASTATNEQERRQDERAAVDERPPEGSPGDGAPCDRESEERGVAARDRAPPALIALSPSSRKIGMPAHRPTRDLREFVR